MIILTLCILFAALMMLAGAVIFIKLNEKYPSGITLLTGFSAGLLLAIIFIGIIPEAGTMLGENLGSQAAWVLPLAIACGAGLIILFEKCLPVQHHHDLTPQERVCHTRDRLLTVTFVAFGLHSLFEFISVIIAGMSDQTVGMLLALVLAIHNIPIGFIIMAQLTTLDMPRKRILRGIALLAVLETAAAVLCYSLLSIFITATVQGVLLGMTAGVMLYLLLDELLPKIYHDEDQHHANYAILCGAVLMILFLNMIGG